MESYALILFLPLAAQPAGPGADEHDPKALGERVKKLEEELARLRLEAAAQEAEKPAEPAPAPEPGPFARLASALNPSLTLFGNAIGRIDDKAVRNQDGERIDDHVNLREAELDARAAVDPYADGVLILTFESEFPGEGEAGVEEGYVTVKRLPFLEEPPLGLKLRGGKFRPAFGRLNAIHTHDLPQSTRPRAVEEFLGEEGFTASGGSAEFFIPTPFDPDGSIDVALQALNSGGLAAAEEARNDFAYLAHLRWFRTIRDAHSIELGLSGYWGPTARAATADILLGGIDLFYKWKPLRAGEWRSFLLGGEVFAADREFLAEVDTDGDGVPDAESRERVSPLGAYAMAQYQFGPRLYLGVRGDWTQSIEDDRVEEVAVLPYVSYYLSEFLRFRVNYQHLWSDRPEDDGRDTVFLELNFVVGAHPPEPFWVNR